MVDGVESAWDEDEWDRAVPLGEALAEVDRLRAACPHMPDGPRYAWMQQPPRGSVRVECPCCHLPGWRDSDPEPMACPYCGVESVDVTEPA